MESFDGDVQEFLRLANRDKARSLLAVEDALTPAA
jgi:hypothetical protein